MPPSKKYNIGKCLNRNCDSTKGYVKEVGYVDAWYGHETTYIITCVKCKNRWKDKNFKVDENK